MDLIHDILYYGLSLFEFLFQYPYYYFVFPWVIAIVCYVVFQILKLIIRQVYK